MSVPRAIKTPQLPEGEVELLALGEKYRGALERPLISRGVLPLWLPPNPKVDPRLAGHADLSLFHLGGDRVVGANESIVKLLTNRGFSAAPAHEEQSPVYPGDCGLCGCQVGRRFIHRLDRTDPAVLSALGRDADLIRVNQGYAKCAVCVVDENSVITSDAGIAAAAAARGIQVLRISRGFIELPGFDEGFIGGASFKLSERLLAFTGVLASWELRDMIEAFLAERGIDPVYLTDDPAFDIGSAIPLTRH